MVARELYSSRMADVSSGRPIPVWVKGSKNFASSWPKSKVEGQIFSILTGLLPKLVARQWG